MNDTAVSITASNNPSNLAVEATKMWVEQALVTYAFLTEVLGNAVESVGPYAECEEIDQLKAFSRYHSSRTTAPFPDEPGDW